VTRDGRTDWNEYYTRPFPLARYTRAYTARKLASYLRRFPQSGRGRGEPVTVIELGGGNSAFLATLMAQFPIGQYAVIDNNQLGLRQLSSRILSRQGINLICSDILKWVPDSSADVVFSVGLVEHFRPDEIHAAVNAHFRSARLGGLVVISFPTPTWLYRFARWVAERLGVWRFHDERPLGILEMTATIEEHGEILHTEVLWPLVFTQAVVVVRKGQMPPRGQYDSETFSSRHVGPLAF
jgi:SAM-dependent methyltransferase